MSGETARPVLVRGGLVADGIGDDLRRADVRVAGDRIVEIGPDLDADGADVSTRTGSWCCRGSSTRTCTPTRWSSTRTRRRR